MQDDAPDRVTVDPDEAPVGLFLFTSSATPPDVLGGVLAAGGVIAAVIDPAEAAAACRDACSVTRIACLVRDDVEAARQLRAEGVHLGQPQAVAAARAALGPAALIGADCGTSRHAAMVAGEDGADYVMFALPPGEPDAEAVLADLCDWWSELAVLPCAVDVRGHDVDPGRLVEAGADFIGVQETVWDAAEGPAAAVRALSAVLERARAQRKVRT